MSSSAASLPRCLVAVVLAGLILATTAVAPALGLEQDPTYENGPRTPFTTADGIDEDTADIPGLPATAAAGGVTVIGDSTAVRVPYVQRGADDGIRVHLLAWGGWTIRLHRTVTGWPSSDLTSLDAAATDSASTVYVALGVNDVGCLQPFIFCPHTPDADSPQYDEFRRQEREKVAAELNSAATELLGSGKCVLWAGPRPGNIGYASDADVEWFNDQLRDIAAMHPGHFTYVDYADFSNSDPALRADFADPASDGIHTRTDAGRASIADLAITSVRQDCPVVTEPRVAISPPLPPSPPPAPSPAPSPPTQTSTTTAPGTPLAPAPPLAPSPPVVAAPEPQPQPAPVVLAQAPGETRPTGCADRPTAASRLSCRRTQATNRCHASRTPAARSLCLRRVRQLYGPPPKGTQAQPR